MTTKIDSFHNAYVVVDSNDVIETITHYVRKHVVRNIKCVRNNETHTNYEMRVQTIVINVCAMIREYNMTRVYINDVRDNVDTYMNATRYDTCNA